MKSRASQLNQTLLNTDKRISYADQVTSQNIEKEINFDLKMKEILNVPDEVSRKSWVEKQNKIHQEKQRISEWDAEI